MPDLTPERLREIREHVRIFHSDDAAGWEHHVARDRLVAAAPDLLDEVTRLRAELDRVREACAVAYLRATGNGDKAIATIIKEVRAGNPGLPQITAILSARSAK